MEIGLGSTTYVGSGRLHGILDKCNFDDQYIAKSIGSIFLGT